MTEPQPEARFVRALAAGILRQDGGDAPVAAAHAALREALAAQRSLVLDVQFTGFTRRGEAVGGVHPVLLRAAAQLIMLRVTRLGFTADAGEGDLRQLFDVLGRPAAELPEGVVPPLREAAPRGVYVSTSLGEVYRPAVPAAREEEVDAREAGREPASAAAAAPPGDIVSADSLVELAAFELLDEAPAAPRITPQEAAPAGPPPRVHEEPRSDDLYHFFRTSSGGRAQQRETGALADALRSAQAVMSFDEAAQAAVAAVPRLLDEGDHRRALHLLGTLVDEARRPDRSRIFRDTAQQSLRRVATEPVLNQLAELLTAGGEVREQVLRVFLFVGADAFSVLEATLFRTSDDALREAIFRALAEVDPGNTRLLGRAMADTSVARTRSVLELAVRPGADPGLTAKWLERAARHPDADVRSDVVRHATQVGGRSGARLILDLLADADPHVRREAVRSLGQLAEPAAVPFLARILNDAGDDELQLEAVYSLGRIASPETLPVLTAVVNRKQLFGGKRLLKLKLAAVAAIGRIPLPAARDVLGALAGGRDAELAAEAKRLLATSG